MQRLPRHLFRGAAVHARAVACVLEATVPHDDCCELHLSELRLPRRTVLLWPFDRPAAANGGQRLIVMRPRKWWRRVAPLVIRARDPLTPRAVASKADVLAYQLAPAVAAASGVAGLLLADEVGLGKTVQAGWIIADRLARNPDARVLVAVPAGIRHQWASELSRHFGIEPNVATAQWLRRTTASMPADVSPWAAPGVYLASIDFLKRADLVRSLEQIDWDLLVADEAHLAASPTDRFSALQQIGSAARQVVLITATPYAGDPAAFNSMVSLVRVEGAGEPVMFRRSREDAGDRRRRRHRFALVGLTPDEQRLQRLLEEYSREVWRAAPGDREQARLAVTILRKRALSSPAAALRSLVRRDELLKGFPPAPRQLSLFDEERETDAEDDVADSFLAVPGLADQARERRTLGTLIQIARRAAAGDSKRRRLLTALRRLREEAVIVFTEYRDTLADLAGAIPGSLQLHGGLGAAERAGVQALFNEHGGVLLATDAASHGLNLQHRCRVVVNYELPWNPARLEQRIGRVDRIGQHRPVHAITLVARDTAEDLVLANIARRLLRVARSLGARDRLASFLTDARAAGIVIGGDTLPADDLDPCVAFAPASIYEELASRAAMSLQTGKFSEAVAGPDGDVFVTSICSSAGLVPGAVFVVRCRAAGTYGESLAEKTVLLHVGGMRPRVPSASRLRRVADSILEALGENVCVAAARVVQTWYESAAAAHAASVDRRVRRESALLQREVHSSAVQAGLFDRRAVRQAERAALVRQRTGEAREDRLRALERSREVRLRCQICAVLIAWR